MLILSLQIYICSQVTCMLLRRLSCIYIVSSFSTAYYLRFLKNIYCVQLTVLIFKNILFYYYNCYYLFIFITFFFLQLDLFTFFLFLFFCILYCITPPLLCSFIYLFKGNIFKRVALRQRVNDLIDGFLKRWFRTSYTYDGMERLFVAPSNSSLSSFGHQFLPHVALKFSEPISRL